MRRVDIKTGFLCNNNCRFCVQAHKKKFGNRTTADIKKDLEEARKNCSEVVLTGGEVTIRKDIIELVNYAKKLGFERIQLQTNARMLSYKKLCVKLIMAGANEFSPAIHGHTAELHDYLTRAKGSFNQTVKAIKNLKELNQYVLTNTVITKPNYKYLPELAKLLVKLKVDQYQFAFPHAVGNAMKNFDEIIPRVSLAAPYIHKGLQIGIDAGVKVMAEAMPYCVMLGYEKYISELYIPEGEVRDIDRVTLDWADARKNQGKMKFPQCELCKYDNVCEGPWKEYPERFGSEEFQPILKDDLNKEMIETEKLFMEKLNGNVLDIGCGYLPYYNYYEKNILKGRINSVHCFDPNPSIKLISKRIPKKMKNKFVFEVNILEKASLEDNKYDTMIMRYTFNHFTKKEDCIKKLYDALKSCGKIYFIDGVNTDKEYDKDTQNWVENDVKKRIIQFIKPYKNHLSTEDYKNFEERMLKYYHDEPSNTTYKHYNLDEIINLVKKAGFHITHKLSGLAFGENTLQLILVKK